MTDTAPARPPHAIWARVPAMRIFATVFAAALLYVWPMPAPMALRQLYLARALAEGRLSLEGDAARVGDSLRVGDRVYSATPPLVAALGAPVVAGLEATRVVPVQGGWSFRDEVAALLPFTIAVSALASAASAVFAAWAAAALGASSRAATGAALVYALATPALPYSTIAYSNASAAAGLLLAISALARSWPKRPGPGFATAGLGLGLAVLSDYSAGVPAALLGLVALFAAGPAAALRLAAGAAVPLIALLAYHGAITGRAFTLVLASPAYSGLEAFSQHEVPDVSRFFHVLVGPWQGLLLYWPVIALGGVGLVQTARRRPELRSLAIGLLAVALGVVLAGASRVFWTAPESYGPRYILLAVPCLAPGLAAGLAAIPRLARAVAIAISLAFAWAGTQTGWHLGVFESALELAQLGPRLRGIEMLWIANGWADPELAGAVAAAIAVPLLLVLFARIWSAALGARRALRIALAGSLAHALLLLPYFAAGRGAESRIDREAALRSTRAEAQFTKVPIRLVQMADQLIDLGDRDGAARLIDRVLGSAITDPDLAIAALRCALRIGDFAQIEKVAAALRQLRPDAPDLALVPIAELWHRGQRDEATARLRALAGAHPELQLYVPPDAPPLP